MNASSERITDGNVEYQVFFPPCFVAEIYFIDHPTISLGQPGFAQRKGYVQPYYEKGQVHAQSKAGTDGNFLVEVAAECRAGRSEERRVRKECVSRCRSRWSPKH